MPATIVETHHAMPWFHWPRAALTAQKAAIVITEMRDPTRTPLATMPLGLQSVSSPKRLVALPLPLSAILVTAFLERYGPFPIVRFQAVA